MRMITMYRIKVISAVILPLLLLFTSCTPAIHDDTDAVTSFDGSTGSKTEPEPDPFDLTEK